MRSASLASGTRVLDAIKQMGAKHTVTQPLLVQAYAFHRRIIHRSSGRPGGGPQQDGT